jgi:magnesium chelatase family protein
VETARERQRARFNGSGGQAAGGQKTTDVLSNADMCPGEALMRSAMSQLQLSARAYHRVLKLARTIADLAGEENIAAMDYALHMPSIVCR